MDNVKFIKITDPLTNEVIENVVIDNGNDHFISMLKSTYEAMQAEQSTPNIVKNSTEIVPD
jgi:hypothetical protein